jgi:hypothetical protein
MRYKTAVAVAVLLAMGFAVKAQDPSDGPVVRSERNANNYPDQTDQPKATDNAVIADAVQNAPLSRPLNEKELKAVEERQKREAKWRAKWQKHDAKGAANQQKVKAQFPQLDDYHCAAIAKHQIFIGMTADMLRASWHGVGQPILVSVNTTVDANGTHQQAVYKTFAGVLGDALNAYSNTRYGSTYPDSPVLYYVYFTNGTVTAFQL